MGICSEQVLKLQLLQLSLYKVKGLSLAVVKKVMVGAIGLEPMTSCV